MRRPSRKDSELLRDLGRRLSSTEDTALYRLMNSHADLLARLRVLIRAVEHGEAHLFTRDAVNALKLNNSRWRVARVDVKKLPRRQVLTEHEQLALKLR